MDETMNEGIPSSALNTFSAFPTTTPPKTSPPQETPDYMRFFMEQIEAQSDQQMKRILDINTASQNQMNQMSSSIAGLNEVLTGFFKTIENIFSLINGLTTKIADIQL